MQSPTALLVDDDPDARIIYAGYLRWQGWRVVTAVDGRVALDKVKELIPEVVVLDLAMPRVDGWTGTEGAARLKLDRAYPRRGADRKGWCARRGVSGRL